MLSGFDEGMAMKNNVKLPFQCMYRDNGNMRIVTGAHYHNYVEIIYGMDCDMNVWVNDTILNIKTGDIVVIKPLETHTIVADSGKTKHFVIKLMPSVLEYEGQLPWEINSLRTITSGATHGYLIKSEDTDKAYVLNIIQKLRIEWEKEYPGREMYVRGKILELFAIILKILGKYGMINESAYDNEFFSRIHNTVKLCTEKHGNLTEKEAADFSHMSYSYFSRSFKEVMGVTFVEYINKQKIDNAIRQLLTTNMTVTEIAVDNGFSTASHFISNFKKKMGFSPYVYKKRFKEKYETGEKK